VALYSTWKTMILRTWDNLSLEWRNSMTLVLVTTDLMVGDTRPLTVEVNPVILKSANLIKI
jgi:hypothetical protein